MDAIRDAAIVMIRSLLIALSLTVSVFGYVNNGSVTNAVIDDAVFINNGYFEVQSTDPLLVNGTIRPGALTGDPFLFSSTPWDSSNTTDYTNNGQFVGVSMRFDTVTPGTGERRAANSFYNTSSGVMDAANINGLVSLSGASGLIDLAVVGTSSVRVQANNVVNEGLIRAGTTGAIGLIGNDVDLSFGTLAIDPLGYYRGQSGFCILSFTLDANGNWIGYYNDAGILDIQWGTGGQTNLNVSAFMTVNPIRAYSYPHDVSTGGRPFPTAVLLTNAQSWALAYQLDATNVVIQAAFVQTGDTNVFADVEWVGLGFPNGVDNNKFLTTKVKIFAPLFDLLSLQTVTNQVTIFDQLASTTNLNLISESIGAAASSTGQRAGAYVITRCDNLLFGGIRSNWVVSPSDFWQPNFATTAPSNTYAGHTFTIDSLPSRPDPLPGVTVKDFPGRIEIEATNSLSLFRTGMRGEGLVSVYSDNLTSSEGTVIDSQNLNFDLAKQIPAGATTASLPIQNLSRDMVERFSGEIQMWSGNWTNLVTNIVSGEIETWAYHVTMVDASQVRSKQEVTVADFKVRAPTTDVTIFDNMIVSNRFEVQSLNLTVDGRVELRGSAWATTNLPNLVNFTNTANGRLQLMGEAIFARPNGGSLTSFNNAGTINSYSFNIDATDVENSGDILSGQRFTGFNFFFLTNNSPFFDIIVPSAGPITVNARNSAVLDGGSISTQGDINLIGPVYKFNDYNLLAGATVNLTVSDAIQDSGTATPNLFTISNAFNLTRAPAFGNLLGSTVSAVPAPNRAFRMRWAARDLGTNVSVWNMNTAIGHLILNTPQTNSVFEFRPETAGAAGRAIYVDLLEITGPGLTNLATLTANLFLRDGITIYYSDVIATNLVDDARADRNKTVEEWLNGRTFGTGKLVWAPNFAGPNSSIDVPLFPLGSGVTQMNRALRESLIVDTDGDGIPNGLDDFPLNNQLPPLIMVAPVQGTPRATITFRAQPNVTYVVESAPSVASQTWSLVQTYRSTQAQPVNITVTDAMAATDATRFYRVRQQ